MDFGVRTWRTVPERAAPAMKNVLFGNVCRA